MNDEHRTTHIVIVDGTLSRLDEGFESNAGLLYKLLQETAPQGQISVFYDQGIHGAGLRKWLNAATGIGINKTICAAYTHLSRHYKPGDKIMLFGYSRGAYAVRSLAGMIGHVGLLRAKEYTPKRNRAAFRYYETGRFDKKAQQFCTGYCHRNVEIELVGVWDTVKALGLPYPILSRFAPMATEFHDHHLSPMIRNAFQALALDENRAAYKPILWDCVPNWRGRAEQLWFAGAHADVGGQVEAFTQARPLSNIPLIWMLEKAEHCGLNLPEHWKTRFPTDPAAPMYSASRGLSRLFLFRKRRNACLTPFDHLHHSVLERQAALSEYHPIACFPKPVANMADIPAEMVRD